LSPDQFSIRQVTTTAMRAPGFPQVCGFLEQLPPTVTDTPLMPANAGIQSLAKELGPRFRGDEREDQRNSVEPKDVLGGAHHVEETIDFVFQLVALLRERTGGCEHLG
jgi:hypothetical protein